VPIWIIAVSVGLLFSPFQLEILGAIVIVGVVFYWFINGIIDENNGIRWW